MSDIHLRERADSTFSHTGSIEGDEPLKPSTKLEDSTTFSRAGFFGHIVYVVSNFKFTIPSFKISSSWLSKIKNFCSWKGADASVTSKPEMEFATFSFGNSGQASSVHPDENSAQLKAKRAALLHDGSKINELIAARTKNSNSFSIDDAHIDKLLAEGEGLLNKAATMEDTYVGLAMPRLVAAIKALQKSKESFLRYFIIGTAVQKFHERYEALEVLIKDAQEKKVGTIVNS